MDYRNLSFCATLLIALFTSSVCVDHQLPTNKSFDEAFNKFLNKHQYEGAAIALSRHGKLIYARGYGKLHKEHKITPETLFPVSSIAKMFTAVSILKLAEENKLVLSNKVFGKRGILGHLKPWGAHHTDKLLYDITIDDLLRHAAGWNANKPPLFDPLLNSVYLSKGYRVPNITDIMKLSRPLELRDVIRYVISLPLHDRPGTHSTYSNFGYVILERIIEKVQELGYADFVRKNILEPCGMWHTKGSIANHHHDEKNKKNGAVLHMPSNTLHAPPEHARVEWHSNVYDVMRFSRCLDYSGDHHLLNASGVRMLLEKPSRVVGHVDSWMGAGINVNKHGHIWQESDMNTDDMLFYHKGLLKSMHKHHNSTHSSADAFVMLLVGRKNKNLFNKEILHFAKNFDLHTPDYFNYDLSDIQIGTPAEGSRIVKYQVPERHISAYVSAIREQDFKVEWISAYEFKEKTFFSVIAHFNPGQTPDAFYLEHGLEEKRLLHYKHVYAESHAYLKLIQTYKSYSHGGTQKYMALFNKESEPPVDIKFGIRQYSQSYKLFAHVYNEKGYVPRIQSFFHINHEPLVCFILEKKPIKFSKEYMNISLRDLIFSMKLNFKSGRVMTYLDSSSRYKKPRFSVIYRRDTTRQGLFKHNLTASGVGEVIAYHYFRGSYFPKLLVGYVNKKGVLHYAVYLERKTSLKNKKVN
ncbi:Hypothetical predicted protein [Octopus vulgaris]|uniref:Beta-lactamase-related domain-containing protein n=1 Tax=Octopus vulgaris TaxID=6645 RepID=A0AA36AQA4_OCTVU|nr:Hypothetical predicted protein [Octopus vulgaris]